MAQLLSKEDADKVALLSGETAKELYPDEYLNDVCRKIGIKSEEDKKLFSHRVRYSCTRYIDLKKMNSGRIRPSKQKMILDQYKKALEQAQISYREIQKSTGASGKLGNAVRKRFEKTTEPGMKDMFKPYCTETGMAITLFDKFLGELIAAAEDAKHLNLGNDKADLTKEFLIGWVTAIGKAWPKDSKVSFALGKYDKEETIYTSSSIPILKDIVCKVESEISEKDIETIMRKIKLEDLVDQPVASFFLA